MSFQAKLDELSALGAEIARRRHQIGTLEIERGVILKSVPESLADDRLQACDRKLLAERLDLHLAETRRDVLRLEALWAISDRTDLLNFSDLEDVAP